MAAHCPLPECDGAPGTLTGAVAPNDVGDEIVLGDVDLQNEKRGCFAG
ncbi:MAG TPA: hypothetical protein VF115_00325 [Acidimicrobiia bacterium]